MSRIRTTIFINDREASDLFGGLLEMEVEEDHRLAAAFRVRLATARVCDGLWNFLDGDARLKPWGRVRIAVGVAGEEAELIRGNLTQVATRVEPEESNSYVELKGLDATGLMDLEEKIRDWPATTDGDIARKILREHGLTPEVDDTRVVHESSASTIIQRETDIRFLRRLARRNGFECFAREGRGYFRAPALGAEPRPVLAAHFGPQTNLTSFEGRMEAERPTAVEMRQLDVISKESQSVSVSDSRRRGLGRERALAYAAAPSGVSAKTFVRHAVATGREEMENLSRAVFDEAEWFIEGEGEVDAAVYGAVLRARELVPVKGVGELFSGVYYLTNVKHLFRQGRYVQRFRARRNAAAPKGPGDFKGGGLFGGLR